MKSTHKGTCQFCHALQKLPNGRLSLHGYEVLGGWFSGECRGSHRLPLEQSFDMVQESIDLTVEAIGRKETKIEEVENSTGIYYYESFKGNMEAPVDKTDPENWTYEQTRNGISQVRYVSEGNVKNSRIGYVMDLEREIRTMNQYITDQTARVENWEPKPLTEIK